MSDHGESLGENGLYLHGVPYALAPEQQTHVPMVSWLSPGLQTRSGVSDCLSERPLGRAGVARQPVPHRAGLDGCEDAGLRPCAGCFRALWCEVTSSRRCCGQAEAHEQAAQGAGFQRDARRRRAPPDRPRWPGPGRCRARVHRAARRATRRSRDGPAQCLGHRLRSRMSSGRRAARALTCTVCCAHCAAFSSRLPSISCRSCSSPAKAQSAGVSLVVKRQCPRCVHALHHAQQPADHRAPPVCAGRAGGWKRPRARGPDASRCGAGRCLTCSLHQRGQFGRRLWLATDCSAAWPSTASGVLSACARLPACVRARATTSALRSSTPLKSSISGCISSGNAPCSRGLLAFAHRLQSGLHVAQGRQANGHLGPGGQRQQAAPGQRGPAPACG